MTTNLNTSAPEKHISPWIRALQFLLLVAFVVATYLIGLEMVHHRFFQGGRVDRYGHIRQ